ncbi:MAG TPA: MSMEG_4193 family putative phosphomutase [Mycobacteriales bacterium]|nr:MSMEG_4193 family putative phosphomutase [Mycobacteriales bacterium]
MPTVLLIRHGLTANTGTSLSGRTPGLHLDDRGRAQVAALASRLAAVPLAAVVTSPLERCVETAETIARDGVRPRVDERFIEVGYGDWTGRTLRELAKEPLWKVVQQHPSAAVFPNGEGLAATQARAVAAVREWNDAVGADATYAICSHGDVIKAILADALGLHLDQFQRIMVHPCSVSVVSYTATRPFVIRVNDVGGSVADLLPAKKGRRHATADAVVGGGAGAETAAVPAATPSGNATTPTT